MLEFVDGAEAAERGERFLRRLGDLVELAEGALLPEERQALGDEVLDGVGIADEILVADQDEALVAAETAHIGDVRLPQAERRVIDAAAAARDG